MRLSALIEKTRGVASNSNLAGSALTQFSMLVVQFAALIILAPRIGIAAYGQLSVMYAVFTILILVDLGLPGTIESRVARRLGATVTVIQGFLILAVLGLLLALVGLLALLVGSDSTSQFGLPLVLGGMSLPLSITLRLRYALGAARISGCYALAAAAVSIGFLWVYRDSDWKVAMAFLALALPRVIFQIIDTAHLLSQQFRRSKERRQIPLGPGRNLYRPRTLLAASVPLWTLQLIATMSYQLDILIVGWLLGDVAAGQLAIATRLMSVLPMLAAVLLAAKWSDMARYTNRGVATRALIYTSAAIAGSSLMLGVGILVISNATAAEVWLAEVPPELLFWSWLWASVAALAGTLATYSNSRGLARKQIRSEFVALAANLVLSIWLAVLLGVEGPIIGSLVAFCFLVLPNKFRTIVVDLRAMN